MHRSFWRLRSRRSKSDRIRCLDHDRSELLTDSVVWLYQLSSSEWDQALYRLSVSEGERVAWPVGKKQTAREPEPGDRIVCWWAKTSAPEYGIIGWGVIDGESYGAGIRWHPRPPSDRWSMAPLTSPDLEAAIDKVRGGMRQATLFAAEGDDAVSLMAAIRAADQ